MKSYFGTYRGEHTSREATVLVFDRGISIGFRDEKGVPQSRQWRLGDIVSEYLLSQQSSRLSNRLYPNQVLLIAGPDAHEFLASLKAARSLPWYRRPSGKNGLRNTALLAAILTVLFGLYLLIVPWLAAKMASRVSVKTEQQMGDAVYQALNMAHAEDARAGMLLNAFFEEMKMPGNYDVRISVVNEGEVNAFALPGGRIIVYSGLLDRIRSYPALAALLCHEFVHVDSRHATRSIFRRMGSKLFLAMLFGSMSSVTSLLVDQADNLKFLSYSRKLETEADTRGMDLLLERRIDPRGYEELFQVLEASSTGGQLPEILASHPRTDKRKEKLRQQAGEAKGGEHPVLKAIFEQLNNR